MKARITMLMVFGLVFGLCVSSGVAQTEEKAPELYVFWDEVIHPSKVDQYVEAGKKLVALYKDVPYKWWVTSTDDMHFYYGIPVENFADVDAMFKAFEETEKKLGPKADELDKSFAGTTVSSRMQMWRLSQELSYTPENPRVKEEDINFYRIAFFYYQGDKGEEAEAIVKKYKELYKSKNMPDEYSVWVGTMGTDNPVHCFVMGAKSSADYYSRSAEIDKLLGDEGDALRKEFMSIVRKIERKNGRPRPELGTATPPETPTEANQ